jgi:hypothetical protein
VDWRLGFAELVFSAYGSAADYDEVEERRARIDETVVITYDYDDPGVRVGVDPEPTAED